MKETVRSIMLFIILMMSATAPLASNAAVYDSQFDKTIEGRDEDKDGLRDDIQQYLDKRYSGYPILRGEMERYSKALEMLMKAKSLSQMLAATKTMDASKYCAIAWGYSEDEFIRHSSAVYDKQVNTRIRMLAAAKAERSILSASLLPRRNKPYAQYCEQKQEKGSKSVN
ncbi:TPA: hypothetical protein ACGSTL_001308 [Vibrio parahaemolyticus]|uniref:hypothetical protein n=1 Tax=Vibrio campbellii TaxID=680 RepID=UPI001F0751E3|nr:hypothetical protein [Vibrio campbellii]UMM06753.1 hypothetical protein MKR81_26195 [Vibrio campbellii]